MAHSIDIDFFTQSNAYLLTVTDASRWGVIENKISVIDITIPGFETPVRKVFDKYKVNNFNSSDLSIACTQDCGDGKIPLPDGIYTIRVTGSPSKFYTEYYYLKTDLFDIEFDTVIMQHVDSADNKIKEKLFEVMTLIRSAEAFTRYSDVARAAELFLTAGSIVQNLKNCMYV